MKAKYKPGPGWKELSLVVYEKYKRSVVRIHISGELIRINGRHIGLSLVRHEIARYIKINGGNRKRGLMAYANLFVK